LERQTHGRQFVREQTAEHSRLSNRQTSSSADAFRRWSMTVLTATPEHFGSCCRQRDDARGGGRGSGAAARLLVARLKSRSAIIGRARAASAAHSPAHGAQSDPLAAVREISRRGRLYRSTVVNAIVGLARVSSLSLLRHVPCLSLCGP